MSSAGPVRVLVAVPAISTGTCGFPVERAARIAARAEGLLA